MLSKFAKCPSPLQNISEIEVGIWRPFQLRLIKSLVLNFRTTLIFSASFRNVSRMRRLYTARFFGIKVKQEHLALPFQSNCLQHLMLSQCSLPRLVRLPPSRVHCLTLPLRGNCKLSALAGRSPPHIGKAIYTLSFLVYNGLASLIMYSKCL